jgi:hypothetical protein
MRPRPPWGQGWRKGGADDCQNQRLGARLALYPKKFIDILIPYAIVQYTNTNPSRIVL